MASSVLLHGLLLVLAVHLAGLFSVQTKTQAELTPIEMVELPPEPTLEKLTNEVGEASPMTPAPVTPVAPSSAVELATPQAVPSVPPQPATPVPLPAPVPTSVATSPTPTPVLTPPAPSAPAVSPSPLLPPAQPVPASPPTANVQPIDQAMPTVLPQADAQPPSESPAVTDPNLAPVAIDPEAIPAQVRLTVAIADSPTLSASPSESPAVQQWVFEPNPMTSSCPAMTPSVVRLFGTRVTLQVALGADGQVVRTVPVGVSEDTADSIDYINFVQCVFVEQWHTEPSAPALSPPTEEPLVVEVMVEANDTTP